MNVLLITEDFRTDQFICQPIIKKMFAQIGKANANIRVCLDPLIGGVARATNWEVLEEIIEMRPMINVFMLLVDRDGQAGRREALNSLEQKAQEKLGNDDRIFLAENAWQEIEVWAIAGQQNLPKSWSMQEIRSEPHPKERYFEPLAAERNLLNEPGAGRKTLGREAAQNYRRVRSRCPEDIVALEERLSQWLMLDSMRRL